MGELFRDDESRIARHHDVKPIHETQQNTHIVGRLPIDSQSQGVYLHLYR
jgi:hypothetical protein